ncbi:hypothetical protein MXC99_08785 [Thauera aromatica]|uniref:hypothetical protein n=1 Tax=Thauera aromatica TaxID=59405 RepID=UPI001FFD4663|nr:hypothetical protein [Thauera aromatica]MCK2088266.1 hypothetical protein [Thauera aromatica]
MHHSVPPLILSFCALSTGCASITTGHNQSLSVETRANGQPVAGASCKLENDKGTWYATSPGTAVVRRSYNDLNVRCEKSGHEAGVTAAQSSTKGMAFGNILFGGIIGAAVDVGSGAAYDYPSIISVELGQQRIQQPAPAPAAADSSASPSGHTVSNPAPGPISRTD